MTYIHHVTLTTGHVRQILPDEVSDEAVAAVLTLIERATAGNETVPLPALPGYSLGAQASSKCLVVTVWADGPPSECICTIGIAAHSRCGAGLWRALHTWGTAPVVTDPDRCPPEPWVAAALDGAIVQHMDATEWLGDFERCLAWAWCTR
jgi:hypothetical protein